MKLQELINYGVKYGRLSFWERFEYIKLGRSLDEMVLTQYEIDSDEWEDFDINGPQCYCQAFEPVPDYLKDYYKKRVLIVNNPHERVDMVINNEGEYTICLVGEDEGQSRPIKFCPFCGRKLA